MPPADLADVVIPLSHILIRHEAVPDGVVSFQLADWTPAPAAPQRTSAEARALAEDLAGRLEKEPSQFAALARQYSEDVATQSLGGSLGSIKAIELYRFPMVLDALAALRPGEVSKVVETQYGFHVLQRRPPPESQIVSGSRIVIAYDEAPWLRTFLARWPLPKRSREEAMTLAQAVYERAAKGEPFERLVEEHSDHREASRHGDWGAWSTREPTPFPREVELLAGLEVGEIYPPLDSPFGFEILQRVPNRERKSFAMSTVQQQFDPNLQQADPASRHWVLANVRTLAKEIEAAPARFADLQKTYCCEREDQWIEGRGEPNAEVALGRLRPGEISTEPVELSAAFAIVKRLEPRPVSATEVSFDLPAPDKPDLVALASHGRLDAYLRGFAEESAGPLGLEQSVAVRYVELLNAAADAAARNKSASTTERKEQFVALQSGVSALLGPANFQKHVELLEHHIEQRLLRPPLSPERRAWRRKAR